MRRRETHTRARLWLVLLLSLGISASSLARDEPPPPATFTEIGVDLEPEARRIYTQLHQTLEAELEDGSITAANILVRTLRLTQITSGIVTIDGDEGTLERRVSSAKLDALVELLEDLEPEEPVVVFGRFRADVATGLLAATKAGRSGFELSGKRNQLEDWRAAGPGAVLSAQTQAGGVGIDLSAARHCVFLSQGFSLADYEQAVARIHGPDSTRPVSYHQIGRAHV